MINNKVCKEKCLLCSIKYSSIFILVYLSNKYLSKHVQLKTSDCVVFWPLTQAKMPFQGDAPEGSDTF